MRVPPLVGAPARPVLPEPPADEPARLGALPPWVALPEAPLVPPCWVVPPQPNASARTSAQQPTPIAVLLPNMRR